MTTIRRRSCKCGTAACRIDNALHNLRINWRWICDRHDAQILGGTR